MKKAWEEVRDGSSSFQTAERNVSGFAEKAESELQSVEEVAGAAAMVNDIDSSTLEQITQDAIAMSGIFGTDLNETLRGINALMSNMGLSAEEAFDYIEKGTQNGLDKSGELSDNLAEYSQIWEQAGFSAGEMFSILQNSLDSGAYNLDKVNDFVKEFSISLPDGRIEENVDKFSLGTRNLFAEWQNGKASQKDVFNSIISDLSNMTDQQEALSIASSVWSALGEDNAMKVITSLNNVNDTYSDVKGTMESIEEINYDNFADKTAALKRQVEMDVIIPITEKYMPKIEKAIDYVSEHLDEIVEHAKPIAAGIAAAFAVKKIVDFGTTTVNTVKTIKTAFQILNASNPLGWISLGIGAVVSVGSVLIADAKKKSQEWKDHLEDVRDSAAKIPDDVQKSIEKTQECTQAWEEMHQKISQDGMVEDSDYEAVNKLKAQEEEARTHYETLKQMAEEKPGSVLAEDLNDAKRLAEDAAVGLEIKTGEHADNAGKTFLDTLSASGMSEGEKLDALNRYIEERLNNGDSLNKIAKDIGLDYDSGFATGITDNAGMMEEAVKALWKVAEAHLRISIDSHSPSKLSKSIGGDWDEGFAIGIEEGIPDVSAVSANMANAAVSSILGIMNAQGTAAVSAYSPVLQQAYTTPAAASTSTAVPSGSQAQGDIIISISIGDETIETVVVNAITRANASSGGWSV